MPQVQSLHPSYLRSPEPAQQETKISEETKAKQENGRQGKQKFQYLYGLRISRL